MLTLEDVYLVVLYLPVHMCSVSILNTDRFTRRMFPMLIKIAIMLLHRTQLREV